MCSVPSRESSRSFGVDRQLPRTEEALGVTSEFLKDGTIVIEQDADGKQTPVSGRAGGMATNLPLCVLINDRTCSCAEVMAAALKDHGRGPIIGTRTAGMGTILHPFEMSDGSVLFLAIAVPWHAWSH